MNLILSIAGAFIALLGFTFLQRKKINSDKAIIETIPFKKNLTKLDGDKSVVDALLQTENNNRENIAHDTTIEKAKVQDKQDLLDFFNSTFKSDK